MNSKIKSCFLLLTLITFVSCQKVKIVEAVNPELSPKYETKHLVNGDELTELTTKTGYKFVDLRKPESYTKGHIPGAVSIWRPDIEDHINYEYGGMMCAPEQIETLFSSLGINSTDTLLIYDDRGGADAARLWWLLKIYGFEQTKLIDGGLQAWKAQGKEMAFGEMPDITPSEFSLMALDKVAPILKSDSLATLLGNPNLVLIDTRTANEYAGTEKKKGAYKAGRIPTSFHIDWAASVDYNGDKTFRPKSELEAIYENVAGDTNDIVVAYCHSGVRSAHTTFVLTELLGYDHVMNYDGSWTEWSHLENLPFETDSLKTINL